VFNASEKLSRDVPSLVVIEGHCSNSVDRATQLVVDNDAMFVVRGGVDASNCRILALAVASSSIPFAVENLVGRRRDDPDRHDGYVYGSLHASRTYRVPKGPSPFATPRQRAGKPRLGRKFTTSLMEWPEGLCYKGLLAVETGKCV